MTNKPKVIDDGRTVTVRVPISIRSRGDRKLVLAPSGIQTTIRRRHLDSALVKAIARAFRWREILETGEYSTIREIAAAEKINETYVGRVLRLTLLAPAIVDAILTGQQPAGLQLRGVMNHFPVVWTAQLVAFRLIT